jgi:putative cell wall-binding protein
MNATKQLLLCIVLSISTISSAYAHKTNKQLPQIFYINIPVQTANDTWQLSAQYRLPRTETEEALPAVIILHSSSGIDSTGSFYAKALNNAGIATLEIDLWGARGLQGGSANRPQAPQETLPDVFAA